jgi:glycosyltransferase involved in cell wall biosynthesis
MPSLRQLVAKGEEPHSTFSPVRVVEIELSRELPTIVGGAAKSDGTIYGSARVLVRMHNRPVGIILVDLSEGPAAPSRVATQIWSELGDAIDAHLTSDEIVGPEGARPSLPFPTTCLMDDPSAKETPFVSVVVCTMSRPRQLQASVDGLLAMSYPNFEVVVVDNNPDDVSSAELIAKAFGETPQVHYIAEPQRGLSRARNRGVAVARGEIIAFTDDDIVVDREWLSELMRGFDTEGQVGCVTGLTLAAELESHSQWLFESYGTFNHGYRTRLYNLVEDSAPTILYPYTAGIFGGGGNSAVRRTALAGGLHFDPRLGPGSHSFGAEDLDIFLDIILAGGTICYQPTAIAWHEHRRSYDDLRWQVFTYGAGFTAFLTKWTLSNRKVARDLLRLFPRALRLALKPSSNDDEGIPGLSKELSRLERLGFVYGPIGYLRAALAFRQARRQA